MAQRERIEKIEEEISTKYDKPQNKGRGSNERRIRKIRRR